MIERRRQRFEGAVVLISHDEPGTLLDVADAGKRDTELCGQRVELRSEARRCREAELVVVATGKQALERERALRAAKTTIQGARSRKPREVHGRSHP